MKFLSGKLPPSNNTRWKSCTNLKIIWFQYFLWYKFYVHTYVAHNSIVGTSDSVFIQYVFIPPYGFFLQSGYQLIFKHLFLDIIQLPYGSLT